MKIRLPNGTEIDLPDTMIASAIDSALRASHPEMFSAASPNGGSRERTVKLRTLDGRENVYPESVVRAAAAALDGDAGAGSRRAVTHRTDPIDEGAIDTDGVNEDAIPRWDNGVARIAREETHGDLAKAAQILQMREPNLYHQRREAFAGHRLPQPRRSGRVNHHIDW